MDNLSDLADGLRDSVKDGLFKVLPKRKRGQNENFGRKAQVGQYLRDRDNADKGERLYSEYIPTKQPQNKNSRRDGQAFLKLLDTRESRAPVFDRHPNIRTTHLRFQSPLLRKELRVIIEGYNIDFDDEDGFDLYSPFEPLFFARHKIWNRYEHLQESLAETTEEDDPDLALTVKQMKLVIDQIFNDIMAEMIVEVESLEKEKKITYNYLWTLFPRESIVVANDDAGHQQAYQVVETDYLSMSDESRAQVMFDMNCQYVHFDAYRFGFLTNNLTIGYFAGKKDLKDLDINPLEAMPRSKELKKQMVERGKRVLKYQDVQHVQIKPKMLDDSGQNTHELLKDLGRADDHGRAIVDFYSGARRNDRWRKSVKPLTDVRSPREPKSGSAKGKGKAEVEEYIDDMDDFRSESVAGAPGRSSDRNITQEELDSRKRPGKDMQEHNTKLVEADEVHSLLMCPLLHAFSLQSKKWITVNVDSVAPAIFHSNAFDHLVANEKHKSQLLSLVKSQLHTSKASVSGDPIPSKGRGLLVLLSGPPGTGKTLMAESIAEKAERPLYYVDARDLGTSIAEIAVNFGVIMENAREWNAVVLLDEADIYLQTRYTAADSHSSDRTTAFLRQLEYFQGILFLTTNLPQTIDPAIESRIHINIPFPPLAQTFRVSIWEHFLATLSEDYKCLTMHDFIELGQWNINGRQIKNAFRMCVNYCQEERQTVCLQSLEDMIGMSCPTALKEPKGTVVEQDKQLSCNRVIRPASTLRLTPEANTPDVACPPSTPQHGSESTRMELPRGRLLPAPNMDSDTADDPETPLPQRKKRPVTPAKPAKLASSHQNALRFDSSPG